MSARPIVLQIPASSAYLVLVRAATTAVCARAGYPIDRLDDTAQAASEAAALLMRDAARGALLTVSLTPAKDGGLTGVDIDVSVRSSSGRTPRPTTFSWTIVAALVDHVSTRMNGENVELHLRSRQEVIAQ